MSALASMELQYSRTGYVPQAARGACVATECETTGDIREGERSGQQRVKGYICAFPGQQLKRQSNQVA